MNMGADTMPRNTFSDQIYGEYNDIHYKLRALSLKMHNVHQISGLAFARFVPRKDHQLNFEPGISDRFCINAKLNHTIMRMQFYINSQGQGTTTDTGVGPSGRCLSIGGIQC